MYTVHMRHVTATEARKNWFRLLDEAAEGEILVIDREGIELVLHRRDQGRTVGAEPPSYEGLIRTDRLDEADQWSWEWRDPEGLVLRETEPKS